MLKKNKIKYEILKKKTWKALLGEKGDLITEFLQMEKRLVLYN